MVRETRARKKRDADLTLVRIKFQADEDLNYAIVAGVLRKVPEIDFQSALEANLRGLSDLQVLKRASEQHRILITHDQRTIPKYFAQLITSQQSPGVIVISQKVAVKWAIEELILIWSASEPAEYLNTIRTLSS